MKQSIMLNSIFLVCVSVFGFVNAGEEMLPINPDPVISQEEREMAKVKQDGANYQDAVAQHQANIAKINAEAKKLQAEQQAALKAGDIEHANTIAQQIRNIHVEAGSLINEHTQSREQFDNLKQAPKTSNRSLFQKIKDLVLQFFNASSLHDLVQDLDYKTSTQDSDYITPAQQINGIDQVRSNRENDVAGAVRIGKNIQALMKTLSPLSVADRAEVLNIIFEKEWAAVPKQYQTPLQQDQIRDQILRDYNGLALSVDKIQVTGGKFIPDPNAEAKAAANYDAIHA